MITRLDVQLTLEALNPETPASEVDALYTRIQDEKDQCDPGERPVTQLGGCAAALDPGSDRPLGRDGGFKQYGTRAGRSGAEWSIYPSSAYLHVPTGYFF